MSDPLLRTIGSTIRSLRRERGLSQEALADRADIDRSYMSGVERGLRNISVLNLARVAKALDVTLVELIGPIDSISTSTAAGVRPLSREIEEDGEPGS